MDQWIRKTNAADRMKEVTKNGVTYQIGRAHV